jgi:hypothetical protein
MKTAPILIAALAAGLTGCASPGGRPLPVCDGTHLRAANPHGSVLDPAAPANAPASPADTPAPAGHPGCGQ